MQKILLLTAGFLFAFLSQAWAQFDAALLLKNGPLRLGTGLEIQFTQFGQLVAVAVDGSVTLHNAQGVINALIPTFNRTCGNGNPYAITINEISPNFQIPLVPSALTFTAQIHAASCSFPYPYTDVGVTSSVAPIVEYSELRLKVGDPIVTPTGIIATTFRPIGSVIQNAAQKQAKSTLQKIAGTINGWLGRQFQNVSLQRQIKTYKLQFQSAQLKFQNSDLVVTVGLTGQVPISSINKQLGQLSF